MKIGLLSDTHSWLDAQIYHYLEACDEIWHAGDIGNSAVIRALTGFKPMRAVHGNIDGQEVRQQYPQHLHFVCEGLRVWMTHIGGKPPHYTPEIRTILRNHVPDIFVCGHSHILRVLHDPTHPPLRYLNPGAAGKEGFHRVRTLLRFTLQNKKISQMQAIELGERGK